MDEKREVLRHLLATVAYRAARALEGSLEGFADFEGAGKKPVQILAHMGDLFDWALSMSVGAPKWRNSEPLSWADEQDRFFEALRDFDLYVGSKESIHAPIERLLQGPVADALTHVGQLAMLRRLAGNAARGENFYVAEIHAGQVGAEQPAPVKPF